MQEEISSGKYFKQKYDLDYLIEKKVNQVVSSKTSDTEFQFKRKRDEKATAKNATKLMFKYF